MAARPAKGSKRNPLVEEDFPFRVDRAANYWVKISGRTIMLPRSQKGQKLTLEINPTAAHDVLAEVPA